MNHSSETVINLEIEYRFSTGIAKRFKANTNPHTAVVRPSAVNKSTICYMFVWQTSFISVVCQTTYLRSIEEFNYFVCPFLAARFSSSSLGGLLRHHVASAEPVTFISGPNIAGARPTVASFPI
jgi:hypothetical protein